MCIDMPNLWVGPLKRVMDDEYCLGQATSSDNRTLVSPLDSHICVPYIELYTFHMHTTKTTSRLTFGPDEKLH